MKRSLRFALGGTAAIAVLMALVANTSRRDFEVINESGQTISLLSVTVGGKVHQFSQIPPGGKVGS